MMNLIARLIERFRPAEDRVVIDQGAYFARLSDERRRQLRIAAENDRFEWMMAKLVRNWSSATIAERRRPALPDKLPKRIKEWLPGLTVQELLPLSTAAIEAVQGHVFGGEAISAVRRVQSLAECALVFPKPVLDPNAHRVQRFT